MYKKMSVKDWIAVPSNPIQRDTERHARKAKHLLTPSPAHQYVFAAELPNGKLVKLDGHTRALLWERGQVAAPPHVFAATIPVASMKEAEVLYQTYDSKEALESVADKVSGAYNKHNFQPQSALLTRGHVVTALRMAYSVLMGLSPFSVYPSVSKLDRAKDTSSPSYAIKDAKVYDLVNEFSPELHFLDSFDLGVGAASTGVMAAAIVSARRHGMAAHPFWNGVFGGEGNKHGREMDAIQATVELISKRKGHNGHANSVDLMSRTLCGLEKYLAREVMTRVPSPMELQDYLVDHKRPKERLIKKADVKKADVKEAKKAA